MICHENLFGLPIISHGNISTRCHVRSDEETVFVSLDGEITFSYEKSDTVSKRMIWCDIYERGFVTYKQAAQGSGTTPTTVKNWIKRFREEGYTGLQDKVGRGSATIISENTRKQILELRELRLSMREIARRCNCSNSQVFNIINDSKQLKRKSPLLNLEFTEEVQAEDVQTEDVQTEEVQTEEVQTEEVQTEEVQTEEVQTENAESVEVKNIYSEGLLDDKVEARRAKNRNSDRALAVLGKLEDATPYFAPCKHVEYAGIFMAFVVLSQDAYLKIGMKIFKSIGPAFYGLRTTLVTLITLALLRMKRPEHIMNENPEKLGKLLGLDKVFSVKTCRRKIGKLSKPIETINFMKELGNERFKEYKGDSKIVMVDGHTVGYTGDKKVGSTWSSRDNKVINAHTENWVNLKGNAPLFSFETDFNNGLVSSLEGVLDKTKEALSTDSLTCVFDRGGSSALLFETLTAKGYGLITYQKGNYKKIDKNKFKKVKKNDDKRTKDETIRLGARNYNYFPFEQEVTLKINKKVDKGPNKRPGIKDTKRTIVMRDIRILCKDGHQVSILANEKVKISAREIADIMFHRIGSQENIFKYMRQEFDVDGLVSYKFEDVSESVTHPNPKWTKQEKKISKIRKRQNGLLAKKSKEFLFEKSKSIKEAIENFSDKNAISLIKNINEHTNKIVKKSAIKLLEKFPLSSKLKKKFAIKIVTKIKEENIKSCEKLKCALKEIVIVKELTPRETLDKLNQLKSDDKANEIISLNEEIRKEKKILDKMNFKENAKKNDYQKPKSEPKRLMNIVKIAAYVIETKLFDMLSKYYKYNKNEGRAILKNAFKSTGTLKLKPGEIVIQLEEQATPQRTRAINSLVEKLNSKNAKFPGSERIIRFEQTRIKNG